MFRHCFCFVVFVLIVAVNCDRKTYRFVKVEGEKRIPQDIVHDSDANTVTITVGDVSKYSDKVQTVNYHDFDTGYVVFKDIKRQLCLLSLSPIPFPTPFLYNKGESSMSFDYEARVNHALLPEETVTEIAGERISAFCSDYKTYKMELTPLKNQKRALREELGRCSSSCGYCTIVLQTGEYEELTAFG